MESLDPAIAPLSPDAGEEAILLRELAHRTANEVAMASAAIQLTLHARTPRMRGRLLAEAVARLDAFAELNRLLARPMPARVDAAAELGAICRAVAAARPGASRSRIVLDMREAWVDGRTARRAALIAAELVSNAVKYALTSRAGLLSVTLHVVGGDLLLAITDDGPGLRAGAATGTGHGQGIVAELVAHGGGQIAVDTGAGGTSVRVALPIEPASGTDGFGDEYAF